MALNRIVVAVGLLGVALGGPATAADFSFSGVFTQDDEQARFEFILNAGATITVHTLSYGGGTNAQGQAIARGGFDPYLSLFLGSGPDALLININNDAGGPPAVADSVTNAFWDSYIQTTLLAGEYTLVLTQSDNSALGPTLGDGFHRDGQGDFTGPTFVGMPGSFWDANPNQRDGHWALDILNVDAVVPEPATIALVLVGGAALPRHRRRRI